MFKKIVFILLLTSILTSIFAQKSEEVQYDNKKIIVKTSDVPEKYRNARDFQYDENTTRPVTFFEKLWYYFIRILDTIFSDSGVAPYIRYFVYFLIVALAVWLIIKMNFGSVFFKKGKNIDNAQFEIYDENVLFTDFDALISKALEEKNYRFAVRFSYLKLLKNLALREIIMWQTDKTNKDYRNELKKTEYSDGFENLTHNYEYVWYGNFNIGREMYLKVNEGFTSIFKKLNV